MSHLYEARDYVSGTDLVRYKDAKSYGWEHSLIVPS
jgi:hypothetical protein